jgi:hypothetical protein
MNENGDRDTDFTLLDLDPISGEFNVSDLHNSLKCFID